jgi:hypothetical protein
MHTTDTHKAATLLAIHAAMTTPLLDAHGDDAEDTPEMDALWDEVATLAPTRDDFQRAWALSIDLFD